MAWNNETTDPAENGASQSDGLHGTRNTSILFGTCRATLCLSQLPNVPNLGGHIRRAGIDTVAGENKKVVAGR